MLIIQDLFWVSIADRSVIYNCHLLLKGGSNRPTPLYFASHQVTSIVGNMVLNF